MPRQRSQRKKTYSNTSSSSTNNRDKPMFKAWIKFYDKVEPMLKEAEEVLKRKKLQGDYQNGGMEPENYLNVIFFIAILFWGLRQNVVPLREFFEILCQAQA